METKKHLAVPLDFAAVTDHAEMLADYTLCTQRDSPIYDSQYCAQSRSYDVSAVETLIENLLQEPPQRVPTVRDSGMDLIEAAKGPWGEIRKAAEEFYEPGKFTTFIAFEYSPMLANAGMLHRNVIFRNTSVPEVALGAYELPTPEQLWSWLDHVCTGDCEVLAIPHNTNFSWGIAFREMNTDGTPFTDDILEQRGRLEPLVEIFQHKGNSECAPGMGTVDEDCAFEQVFEACTAGKTPRCNTVGSMVRDGLKSGMRIGINSGINPFKYGIIAGTDTHNSIPGAAQENDWSGHDWFGDDTAEERINKDVLQADWAAPRFNPGGLAGVWAEENTRDSLFDALKRKETFGTSGTRIRLRLFGGWHYSEDLLSDEGWIAEAYEGGVPMGGDLGNAQEAAPRFVIQAVKDPNSAHLDRVQIIKGWLEGDELKEWIYDVTCSDRRVSNPDTWSCPPTTASVNLANCSHDKNKGAAQLQTVWTDPEFKPEYPAFYYVRVLENPTCRWSSYDALQLGKTRPDYLPPTIQERAWTSPIWYTP